LEKRIRYPKKKINAKTWLKQMKQLLQLLPVQSLDVSRTLYGLCDLKKRSMLHLQTLWGPYLNIFFNFKQFASLKGACLEKHRQKWDPKSLKKPWPTFGLPTYAFPNGKAGSWTAAAAPTVVSFPKKTLALSPKAATMVTLGGFESLRTSNLVYLQKINSCVLFQQTFHLSYFFYSFCVRNRLTNG